QRDVLDVLKQYEGYFDYFERIGSLSDDSRPDCFARISRDGKKEIWVMDAKKKAEIGDKDQERMERYIDMLKSNPIDAGLNISEISEYCFRGIFITSKEARIEKFESVGFSSLHQFLQKELVYTETERVVRDISKMMQRQELSQSQARLLFRSLRPYERSYSEGKKLLEEICGKYIGFELEEAPFDSLENELPVDVILRHQERDVCFLFDIPYSWSAVRGVDDKAGEIRKLVDEEPEVYYAAINTFEQTDSDYAIRPEKVEDKITEKAGVISPGEIAKLFDPKVRTQKEFFDGKIVVDSPSSEFGMVVRSEGDVRHSIEVNLPEEALEPLKNSIINSRIEFGEVKAGRFRLDIEVTENLEVRIPGKMTFQDFRDKANGIYHSSVNPVLGRKVSSGH
ncbi:MAG: hypothetical protein ABEJ56_01005, partial [Candidatus Nanohaloarchaea archaeon]